MLQPLLEPDEILGCNGVLFMFERVQLVLKHIFHQDKPSCRVSVAGHCKEKWHKLIQLHKHWHHLIHLLLDGLLLLGRKIANDIGRSSTGLNSLDHALHCCCCLYSRSISDGHTCRGCPWLSCIRESIMNESLWGDSMCGVLVGCSDCLGLESAWYDVRLRGLLLLLYVLLLLLMLLLK